MKPVYNTLQRTTAAQLNRFEGGSAKTSGADKSSKKGGSVGSCADVRIDVVHCWVVLVH